MNSYKVKVYVSNNPKDTASGRVFHFPIIPRSNDYINVRFKPDPKNDPLMSESAGFRVKNVFIHEVDSVYDAEIHVESDDVME